MTAAGTQSDRDGDGCLAGTKITKGHEDHEQQTALFVIFVCFVVLVPERPAVGRLSGLGTIAVGVTRAPPMN